MSTEIAAWNKSIAECEEVIERGIHSFVETGTALMRVCTERLYVQPLVPPEKQKYQDFDDYCLRRWNLLKAHAHRLMAAPAIIQNITDNLGSCKSPTGDLLPQSESQVRALTKLSPEKQAEAWEKAVEKAGGAQPTAEVVKAAVAEVAPKPTKRDKDRRAASESKAAKAGAKDREGQPIPKRLSDVFGDQMIPEAMNYLNKLMKSLKSASTVWAKYIITGKAITGLTAAIEGIEAGNPHAVHPACEGAGCDRCRGLGYVPKWRMDELKGQGAWK